MPLTRIWCADPGLKKKGQKVSLPLNECVKCALTRNNPCNYTAEVLQTMYDAQQDRGDRISTTAVIGECTRQTVLERMTKYTIHPDDLWAAFKGTLTHSVLERSIVPPSWGEVRVWAKVPGHERYISCSPDLVDPKAGTLDDYKTAKKIPLYGHVWGNQEAQLQVNRWIIDHAEWEGSTADSWDGFPNDQHQRPYEWEALRIVYITDDGMDVHPVTKSIDVPTADGTGTKRKRVPDIWSDDEVLEYMLPRYEELLAAFEAWPDEVPPIPEDIEWLGRGFPCGWCPVRDECKRLALEEGR